MATTYANSLIKRLPPWWGRLFGAPIVRGLAAPVDEMMTDTSDSIKLRFPKEDSDPAALALIGRERRILRGPHEPASTYATRLPSWLDDHRTRGGPYALARQLWLFWRAALNVPFEIIYWTGRRFSVATDGTVTRDDIAWRDPNGTGYTIAHTPSVSMDPNPPLAAWAEIWIVFHLDGLTATWVDEDGDTIVTDGGEEIIFDVLSGGALTPDEAEDFASVPREWNAAHVKRIHIVLLYGGNRLWGYPRPVKKWGSDWGVWQTDNPGRVEIVDDAV